MAPYTIEHGIVIGGKVLPGTEWVLRDSRAWFDQAADAADVPARKYWPITQMVFHWTAGHTHSGPDAAKIVVRNMKARLNPHGEPMSVSCHFVVSWDGLVFQVADLDRMAIHAGRVLNRDGIGIEQCWPGSERQMLNLRISGQTMPRTVGAERLVIMRPNEPMINASCRLAEALASCDPATRIRIPRIVPKDTSRLKGPAAAAFQGACEHAHSPGSTKLDCAGMVVDTLAAQHRWARAA